MITQTFQRKNINKADSERPSLRTTNVQEEASSEEYKDKAIRRIVLEGMMVAGSREHSLMPPAKKRDLNAKQPILWD